MMRIFPFLIGAMLVATPSMAQQVPAPSAVTPASPASQAKPPKADWSVTLGAGALYGARDETGADVGFDPFPVVDIEWKDLVFLSVGEGLGVNAYNKNGLRAGPVLNYVPDRRSGDSGRLKGLKDLDPSLQAGVFAEYSFDEWAGGLRALVNVSGGSGKFVEAYFGYDVELDRGLEQEVKLSTTWADREANQRIFGVSAEQSARTGLAEYGADGGFKDITLRYALTVALSEHIGVTGILQYRRLLGGAQDSPIVRQWGDANQFAAGLAVAYQF